MTDNPSGSTGQNVTTPEAIDLAALRALADDAEPEAPGFDPEPRTYVNLAGSVCMHRATVLALLDRLAAASECIEALRSAYARGDNLSFQRAAIAYDRAIAGQQRQDGT